MIYVDYNRRFVHDSEAIRAIAMTRTEILRPYVLKGNFRIDEGLTDSRNPTSKRSLRR